jgi:predicted LPLAT superfamily acyltransferase
MTGQAAEWRQHSERGSQRLLGWMAATSLRLGRPASRLILYAIGAYFFLFAPAARRAMRQYLRRVLPHRPRASDRMRLIMSFATCIHDRLFMLAGREELFDITLEGEDAVRAAIAGGGAMLMGAHVGNFEVLRLIGRRNSGLQVTMAMYEDNARKLNTILASVAAENPPEIIAVGRLDSMLKLRECLEHGRLVGVLGDRLFGVEPALTVPFLGAPARFPTNPMRLAATLRCRVVFMLGLYRGANRYHVVFAPLADFRAVEPSARAAAIEAAIRRYVGLLEQHCRRDPYNWFNFYDFWAADPHPQATAGALSSP